jgi:hypothetical protein
MKIADSNKKRSKPAAARVTELEREVANLTMAVRVSQALLKQFMEQIRPMQEDLTRFYAALNDTQYKTNALLDSVPGASRAQIAALADKFKLADWQESSDKDDQARGLVPADIVFSDEDTVIITSTTPDEAEDKGIFRSKSLLKDIANQDIVAGFLNKPVGTTLETSINGSRHVVELLGVRITPKA